MIELSLRNAVRVAVLQVITIVFGVLGAGATEDWWRFLEQPMPLFNRLIMNWGALLMIIPLGYICWATPILKDPEEERERKKLALLSGAVLAMALMVLMSASTLNICTYIQIHDPASSADALP